MWIHADKNFSTPPPTWRKQRPLPSPLSERKRISTPLHAAGDFFHVIHKVPFGDSPYVRAKHSQLIDKNPSRAVSLFWAAINAGDRVDSALKDMAVVMKQLDRSDEAIEAVKSFRHLCPYASQESLDNVLIELYKRSGRIEDEIELLQNKLKKIEDGIAFGGANTKIVRSQAKKIPVEQERSRILGNLAWAYLRQNDYEMAEQYYRKALALGVDKNKQCNLAICLMQMNRAIEAKSLLEAVRTSAGNRQMDSSYARSYERAFQMLTALESKFVLKLTELVEDDDQENQRHFQFSAKGNSNIRVASSTKGSQTDHVSNFSVCRSLENGHDQETLLLNEQHRATAYSRNHLQNKDNFIGHDKGCLKCISSGPRVTSQICPPTAFFENQRDCYPGNPSGRSGFFTSSTKGNSGSSPGIAEAQQGMHLSPVAARRNLEVLFTQPRRSFREFSYGEHRMDSWRPTGNSNLNLSSGKSVHTYSSVLLTQPTRSSSCRQNHYHQWGENPAGSAIRKLTFEQTTNSESELAHTITSVDAELPVPSTDESELGSPSSVNVSSSPSSIDRTRTRSWGFMVHVKGDPVKPLHEVVDGDLKSTCGNAAGVLNTSTDDQRMNNNKEQSVAEKPKSSQDYFTKEKKSWADMVEEEESEEQDENRNANIVFPSVYPENQIDYMNRKPKDSADLKYGYETPGNGALLSRNRNARRALCFFDQQRIPEPKAHFYSSPLPNKGLKLDSYDSAPGMMRRNRLQVFQDITP